MSIRGEGGTQNSDRSFIGQCLYKAERCIDIWLNIPLNTLNWSLQTIFGDLLQSVVDRMH